MPRDVTLTDGRAIEMDRPGYDERGPPDESIEKCDACGSLYPADSWHRCPDGEHKGDVPEDLL